jgi:hypothetical protein
MPRVAGRRRKGESISGYFRKIFEERPQLLDQKSNKELAQRWLADHPGHKEMPTKVKQNLANLKSHLRKKRRDAEEAGNGLSGYGRAASAAKNSGTHKLELLEEHIDDCLSLAKTLDREGLDPIIKLLRRARNEVVWKIGQ